MRPSRTSLTTRWNERGFSLAELMVAVFFTAILMAGMAKVFRSSISSLATSGEVLSSARRNRGSIDLLMDDLNVASMYLRDLSIPAPSFDSNPQFYILPAQPIISTDGSTPVDATAAAAAGDPSAADQLFLFLDEPLPFEGKLLATTAGSGGSVDTKARSSAQLVADGSAINDSDRTYTIDCGSEAYARMVEVGHEFCFKDSFQSVRISEPPTRSGKNVTVKLGSEMVAPSTATPGTEVQQTKAAITGTGYAGPVSKESHIPGSSVLFFRPAQMVRYSVVMMKLDPKSSVGVPCLVRDQGTYNTAFTPDPALRQVISENVSGFKIYLSANSGQGWAGLDVTTGKPKTYPAASGKGPTLSEGWETGIRKELDKQLETAGRAEYKSTQGVEAWFRKIPTMVRVDVTTRTATQRAEYSPKGDKLMRKEMTQSLVVVPRHFGLPMEI